MKEKVEKVVSPHCQFHPRRAVLVVLVFVFVDVECFNEVCEILGNIMSSKWKFIEKTRRACKM